MSSLSGGGHVSYVNELDLARCIRKVAIQPSVKRANSAVNCDFSSSLCIGFLLCIAQAFL